MEAYLGEIRMFGGDFAPMGWALCNGQLLNINENEPLYSLIGTTYGGDGRNTFALPDFQGRVVVHMGQNPTTGSSYMLGQKAGTESVKLTLSQLPAHTHMVSCNVQSSSLGIPTNAVWGVNDGLQQYTDKSPNKPMLNTALSGEGGNQPHDNMMPTTTINYIIAIAGVWPARD